MVSATAARRLSSTAAASGVGMAARRVRPPPPVIDDQEYRVARVISSHLRRPPPKRAAFAASQQHDPSSSAPGDAAAAAPATSAAPRPSKRWHYKPTVRRAGDHEPDTVRVPIGDQKSYWPRDDFETMISDMRTTIGRSLHIPRENVRFQVNLTPVPIDSKACVVSPKRPGLPRAKLVASFIGEQIEAGRVRDAGTSRNISALSREIYGAFGPDTGRRHYMLGIRIQVSGRLGQERAAVTHVTQGRLPLSTIDMDIDYALFHARTSTGVVGVKVWIVPASSGEP